MVFVNAYGNRGYWQVFAAFSKGNLSLIRVEFRKGQCSLLIHPIFSSMSIVRADVYSQTLSLRRLHANISTFVKSNNQQAQKVYIRSECDYAVLSAHCARTYRAPA